MVKGYGEKEKTKQTILYGGIIMITQKDIVKRIKTMDKKFILATVSKDVNNVVEDGVYRIYPTEEQLRTERLNNPYMIWLDDLINPNCKKCYGTGRLGYFRKIGGISGEFIFCPKCLLKNFDKKINEIKTKMRFAV